MSSEREPPSEEIAGDDDIDDLEASEPEGEAVAGGNSQFGKMKDVRKNG